MGCSKNYIMYWGVFTVIIVPRFPGKVCTNFTKMMFVFYAFCILVFSSPFFSIVKSDLKFVSVDFFLLEEAVLHNCEAPEYAGK